MSSARRSRRGPLLSGGARCARRWSLGGPRGCCSRPPEGSRRASGPGRVCGRSPLGVRGFSLADGCSFSWAWASLLWDEL